LGACSSIPTRSANAGTGSVLAQLRGQSIYPSINAPVFNQHGGAVAAEFALAMSHANSNATIYYTVDRVDPRVPLTGDVHASATAYAGAVPISSSRTVKVRVRSSAGVWSALNEATFLVNVLPARAGNLVISKITIVQPQRARTKLPRVTPGAISSLWRF